MKRTFIALMVVIMVFSFSGCADTTVKGSVVRESTSGDAVLDIMPQKMLDKIDVGDTVIVKIGDFSEEMPFVDKLIEEDGKMQLFLDREDWNINVCVYNESFCEAYGIKANEKVFIKKK